MTRRPIRPGTHRLKSSRTLFASVDRLITYEVTPTPEGRDLKRLYEVEDLSYRDLARRFKVTVEMVRHGLLKLGATPRRRGRRGRPPKVAP